MVAKFTLPGLPIRETLGANASSWTGLDTELLTSGTIVSAGTHVETSPSPRSVVGFVLRNLHGEASADPVILDTGGTSSPTGKILSLQVKALPDGGFAVTWAEQLSISSARTMVQYFDADGSPRGDAMDLFGHLANQPFSVRIEVIPSGALIAACNVFEGSAGTWIHTFRPYGQPKGAANQIGTGFRSLEFTRVVGGDKPILNGINNEHALTDSMEIVRCPPRLDRVCHSHADGRADRLKDRIRPIGAFSWQS